ncbi:helix-turn-helix transcriptional regulator [Escherichia coli]|nr:helix-turn-helix transcriptional regulator [Escherichia coli]MCQ0224443.1 helix-turn-helix transcriptional regulator [Escherichia coli]MCQ0244562.1 helix-turn-helix transcriptional regulator [Escherichia coli]
MLPSETMIWQPEFTDKTLSRKTGAVQGAIGHWESGRRFPDLKTCRALVECLNKLGAKVSLDDVFPPEHKAA